MSSAIFDTPLEKLWGLEKALVLWLNPDNVPPRMGGQAGKFPSRSGGHQAGSSRKLPMLTVMPMRLSHVSFPDPFLPLRFCPWTCLFFSRGSIFFSWHFVSELSAAIWHEEQRLLVCMVLDLVWCFCSVIVHSGQDWSPHMSFILKGSQILVFQLKGWFKSETSMQEYSNESQTSY